MKPASINLSPSQINIAGTTIAIGALGICAYAIHSSWESRQSGIESSQLELSQVTEQLSTAQQQRGRLANQISNLQAIVDDTSNTPRPNNINELAVTLVASTEIHGLDLDQFEPEPPRSIDSDQIQSILIRAQCTYQALTNWLDELHDQMPDIHVVSISISTQGPEQATVATDIRLDWYIPNDQQTKTN